MTTTYLELKLAWEMHRCSPDKLDADKLAEVRQYAKRQNAIERQILESPEAARVIVTPGEIADRLQQITSRYDESAEFDADLKRMGLDQFGLEREIARDLHIEGILEHVSSNVEAATEVDAEIYYRLHPKAFERPEHRRLRHILVTFNNPSEKEQARTTLLSLRERIHDEKSFAQFAARHSQCPTAMDGGNIGKVPRGKLYPEIEAVAFQLATGAVSDVVETEIGLHLVRCDEIFPGQCLSFEQALPRILEHLDDRRRQDAQTTWIRALPKKSIAA
jgi:peptidyl-prolyl cis-trans isomerase C